jgi:hypothetical protein
VHHHGIFFTFRISTNLIPATCSQIKARNSTDPELVNNTNFPDIYYIILDGYGREDILKELYHYDNSSFSQALNNRGFNITAQSQSNYIQTILSLASSLNMEYLSGTPSTLPIRGQLMGLIDQSRTRIFLELIGYQYVAFSTAFPQQI